MSWGQSRRELAYWGLLPLRWWAAVSGWVGFGSDGSAVGVGDEVAAVVAAVQGPVPFVEHGVVRGAGQGAVVDDGGSAVGPRVQVVGVGPQHGPVAVGHRAAVAVAGDHRDPLGGGEEPPGALDLPGAVGAADGDHGDVGVA